MVTLGQGSATTNTVTVTVNQAVPAGWLVVAAVAGGKGTVAFTVTDSASNSWALAIERNEQTTQTNAAEAGIEFSVLTHPLVAGDTIAATFVMQGTSEHVLAVVASPDFASLDTTGSLYVQSASSFAVSSDATLSSSTELLVGSVATHCSSTPLTFSLDGGFSELEAFTTATGSGAIGDLTGTSFTGKATFAGTPSSGNCSLAAVVAAFEPGPPVSPTNLSLSHTPNSKDYSVSFSKGRGNGGPGGCHMQYQQSGGTWHNTGSVNCDADTVNASQTLPTNSGLGTWTTPVPMRLVRDSDGAVLGTFPQSLTCSPTAGSATSTPTIDENCDGAWDDTTCSTFTWVYQQTWASNFTACTNSPGAASTYACNSAASGVKRYTDGQSQAFTPTQVWSSDSVGTGCQGTYTGAVQWLCTPSNCTYH